MTVTIPIWLLIAIGVSLVWWGLGYLVNNLVVGPIIRRWMQKHQTSTWPSWGEPVMCVVCGPVGISILFFQLGLGKSW